MRTGTRGDRIQVARPPNAYWATAELLAELGLTEEPHGVPRSGPKPDVARPSNRTAAKQRQVG